MVETRKKLQACLNLVRRPVAQPPVEASGAPQGDDGGKNEVEPGFIGR